ncbi:hypothetical protein LSAT2_008355, partial [Lamellibrachia satsuma]
QLESQIYKCLQKASELKGNSIVFPTVGCGRLGYDPLEVVQCFKRAIKRHASDDICCVSKVIIAAYGDTAYQEFEQLVSMTDSQQPPKARPQQPTFAKGRSSSQGQSGTVFHITALSWSVIESTVNEIKDSIKEYSAEEIVQAEYLAMFSQRDINDITSLNCEDMEIIIDKQSKCIRIVGARQAVSTTIAAVTQKVQAIEERPEFVQQTRGRPAYLECIANQPVEIPGHWKSVRTLQDERAVKMPVDPIVAKAIEDMVKLTWLQKLVGRGNDANNLTHKTINVTKVEQIENPHLYLTYEHARKAFCSRAVKGSFPKVTSDPCEADVLTSTLGISVLDEQLIPEINEHFLFHGAKQEFLDTITQQGIDFRLNNRGMFGTGAYFCESSTKADQYADPTDKRTTGPHSMFLSKVILGHSYIAKKPDSNKPELKTKRPPCVLHSDKQCTLCGKTEFHDSVMGTHRDDGSKLLFREFIIYEEALNYPAYLITYKRM